MNYQLAKKLKDAGFPQKDRGNFIGPPDVEIINTPLAIYVPTLSELIEACVGDRLDFYLKNSTLTVHWSAGMNGRVGNGETPEEAVANLYLALNPITL